MPVAFMKYLRSTERLIQRSGWASSLSGHQVHSETTEKGHGSLVDQSIHKDPTGQCTPMSGIQTVLNYRSYSDSPRTMASRVAFAGVGGDILSVKDWLKKKRQLTQRKGTRWKLLPKFRLSLPSGLPGPTCSSAAAVCTVRSWISSTGPQCSH